MLVVVLLDRLMSYEEALRIHVCTDIINSSYIV
jgi:hypothetical protein